LSKKLLINLGFACSSLFVWAQKAALESFRHRPVMYADLGYNVNPFRIEYPFNKQQTTLAYKNNFRPFLGIGFAYKWFHLRVGFPVIGDLRPSHKFGKTTQYNFGYDLTFKRVWYDFEFKSTFGYALKQPQMIFPNAYAVNVMTNAWYFRNPNFQMNGLLGKRAHYNQQIVTWYLKGTMNYFGSSNRDEGLIPIEMQLAQHHLTTITKLWAFDFGAAPGLAYVNRKKNWQIGGWAGVGPVIQFKEYETPSNAQISLGLAPRFDIRLMGGYSSNEKFFFIVTDFDNKSIRLDNLKYRQIYFALKFVAGYRFKEKEKITPN
jgi:hypothetical protein